MNRKSKKFSRITRAETGKDEVWAKRLLALHFILGNQRTRKEFKPRRDTVCVLRRLLRQCIGLTVIPASSAEMERPVRGSLDKNGQWLEVEEKGPRRYPLAKTLWERKGFFPMVEDQQQLLQLLLENNFPGRPHPPLTASWKVISGDCPP